MTGRSKSHGKALGSKNKPESSRQQSLTGSNVAVGELQGHKSHVGTSGQARNPNVKSQRVYNVSESGTSGQAQNPNVRSQHVFYVSDFATYGQARNPNVKSQRVYNVGESGTSGQARNPNVKSQRVYNVGESGTSRQAKNPNVKSMRVYHVSGSESSEISRPEPQQGASSSRRGLKKTLQQFRIEDEISSEESESQQIVSRNKRQYTREWLDTMREFATPPRGRANIPEITQSQESEFVEVRMTRCRRFWNYFMACLFCKKTHELPRQTVNQRQRGRYNRPKPPEYCHVLPYCGKSCNKWWAKPCTCYGCCCFRQASRGVVTIYIIVCIAVVFMCFTILDKYVTNIVFEPAY